MQISKKKKASHARVAQVARVDGHPSESVIQVATIATMPCKPMVMLQNRLLESAFSLE